MANQSGKRVGVVLSGCGFLDGAEIHEATLTLLALDRRGAQVSVFAPDLEQMHVVDHGAGKPAEGERRNVLTESARIARGQIADLATAKSEDLDALIFPGGFGAAKNLSTFAVDGVDMKVQPAVERLIRDMRAGDKPLGFLCISPVIAAKVLGSEGPQLTIGSNRDVAAVIESLGARHVERPVDEIVIDERLRVVSAPAYMYDANIASVADGIDKLVAKVLELA